MTLSTGLKRGVFCLVFITGYLNLFSFVVIDKISEKGNRERYFINNNKKKYKIEIYFSKGKYKKIVSLLNKQEKRISLEKYYRGGGREKVFYSDNGKTIIKKSYDRNGNGIYDHFVVYENYKKRLVKAQYSLKDMDLAKANKVYAQGRKRDKKTWRYYQKAKKKYADVIVGYKKEFSDYLKESRKFPVDVQERITDAVLGMGYCDFNTARYSQAEKNFKLAMYSARSLENKNHAARSIGLCKIMAGRKKEALKYLNIALDFKVDDLLARNYLVFVYKQLKKYDLAVKILKESLGVVSLEKELVNKIWRAKVEYNLACFSVLAGKKNDALVFLKQAAEHGYSNYKQAKRDRDLRGLRRNKKFKKILNVIRGNLKK